MQRKRLRVSSLLGVRVSEGLSDKRRRRPNRRRHRSMVIGHAYLPLGNYTASETSSAVGGQDPVHMADLIGVFVFGAKH